MRYQAGTLLLLVMSFFLQLSAAAHEFTGLVPDGGRKEGLLTNGGAGASVSPAAPAVAPASVPASGGMAWLSSLIDRFRRALAGTDMPVAAQANPIRRVSSLSVPKMPPVGVADVRRFSFPAGAYNAPTVAQDLLRHHLILNTRVGSPGARPFPSRITTPMARLPSRGKGGLLLDAPTDGESKVGTPVAATSALLTAATMFLPAHDFPPHPHAVPAVTSDSAAGSPAILVAPGFSTPMLRSATAPALNLDHEGEEGVASVARPLNFDDAHGERVAVIAPRVENPSPLPDGAPFVTDPATIQSPAHRVESGLPVVAGLPPGSPVVAPSPHHSSDDDGDSLRSRRRGSLATVDSDDAGAETVGQGDIPSGGGAPVEGDRHRVERGSPVLVGLPPPGSPVVAPSPHHSSDDGDSLRSQRRASLATVESDDTEAEVVNPDDIPLAVGGPLEGERVATPPPPGVRPQPVVIEPAAEPRPRITPVGDESLHPAGVEPPVEAARPPASVVEEPQAQIPPVSQVVVAGAAATSASAISLLAAIIGKFLIHPALVPALTIGYFVTVFAEWQNVVASYEQTRVVFDANQVLFDAAITSRNTQIITLQAQINASQSAAHLAQLQAEIATLQNETVALQNAKETLEGEVALLQSTGGVVSNILSGVNNQATLINNQLTSLEANLCYLVNKIAFMADNVNKINNNTAAAPASEDRAHNYALKVRPIPTNYRTLDGVAPFPTPPSFGEYLKASLLSFDPKKMTNYLKVGAAVALFIKVGHASGHAAGWWTAS